MKSSVIISYVGWLLLIVAFGFYTYGIIEAIRVSWGPGPIKGTYNEVLSATVGSIQALLLTNLGMLLGVSILSPNSSVARHLLLNKTTASAATATVATVAPLDVKEKVQLFALIVFIISLVACLITWIVDDFSSNSANVVSLVAASGKMFIGVVLAYLTATLR